MNEQTTTAQDFITTHVVFQFPEWHTHTHLNGLVLPVLGLNIGTGTISVLTPEGKRVKLSIQDQTKFDSDGRDFIKAACGEAPERVLGAPGSSFAGEGWIWLRPGNRDLNAPTPEAALEWLQAWEG
jgi:hypothetical protein